MKILLSIALWAIGAWSAAAPAAEPTVADHLQAISVTIRAGGSEGSGVAFARDGHTFVWTAGHVVDGLRSTRTVIDSASGTPRTVVEFKNASIVTTLIEGGRKVGDVEMDADVIRYSDADFGEDLALLLVRKKNYIGESATFYDGEIPVLGTTLLHVGSLLGQTGSNSMTTGIMSQHGRLIGKKEFDQTTVTAFPGSSGGGVYLQDGKYVGMLVRGAGETFNLIVPIRRMRAWAAQASVLWAIDPNQPMPSAEDMKKLPIEDVGTQFAGDAAAKPAAPAPPMELEFPFLLRTLPAPTLPLTSPIDNLIDRE